MCLGSHRQLEEVKFEHRCFCFCFCFLLSKAVVPFNLCLNVSLTSLVIFKSALNDNCCPTWKHRRLPEPSRTDQTTWGGKPDICTTGLGLPDGADLWAPKPLFSSFLRSGYSAGAISIALPCRMLFCSGTWENLTLSQPGAKSHTPFHLLNHEAFYPSLTAFYGG